MYTQYMKEPREHGQKRESDLLELWEVLGSELSSSAEAANMAAPSLRTSFVLCLLFCFLRQAWGCFDLIVAEHDLEPLTLLPPPPWCLEHGPAPPQLALCSVKGQLVR